MARHVKKLRVLVLVHEDFVAPETLEGLSESEVGRIKTEYDVIEALTALGHEVRQLGISEVLRPIRVAIAEFDPEIVFAACAQFDTAVEINCRPERQDPPEDLLELALEWECKVAINTDAHATGQLEWQPYGADKAVRCGVPVDDIVNTWSADDVLEWTASHAA